MFEESRTLVDFFYATTSKFPEKDFLLYKKEGVYTAINYKTCMAMVHDLKAGLYDLGIRKGDKVGIISDNQYKWMLSDLAVLTLGAADVPRGSDSNADEISYILSHSEAKACFAENPVQADKIFSEIEKMPDLEFIVLFNGKKEDLSVNDTKGVQVFTFEELSERGRKVYSKHQPAMDAIRESIREEDLATLIYTSGTTGIAKGVMLTHYNIASNVHALTEIIPQTEKERWLSVLPVWHVFERTVEYCILATGAILAYSKPTAKHLVNDLAAVKPTFMVSVPRIWEAVYTGILRKVRSRSVFARALFHFFLMTALGFAKSVRELKNNNPHFKRSNIFLELLKKAASLFGVVMLFLPRTLGDVLLFSKIRKQLGGQLNGPISGGGALAPHIDDFFAAIQVHILEGYGLTETSPVVSVRTFERTVVRTVGRPIPGVQVMIGDEEFNPLENQSSKGIVYIKGDLIMSGYYKDPDKTMEVIKEGWFNTGDLGRLTITGELQLMGRAKDTIVLSGGENIEPTHIEAKLLNDEFIFQVLVVGQDRKNLGALIVPDQQLLTEYADQQNIGYSSYKQLLEHKDIIDKFDGIIKYYICQKNNFKAYERITCFTLLEQEFKAGEEMTHTQKLKRNVIFDNYKKEIDKMYRRQ